MNHHNAISADTEITSPGVHKLQSFMFLLANVSDTEIIGVQKFDDPAFERHV
jgi:hypothetical protein